MDQESDRIRSIVASKWLASIAASPRKGPHRPQSSPTTRSGGGDPLRNSGSAPSWARGNPYAKAFPRARTWTRRHVPGLSGRQPPSGWDVVDEKCTEQREEISAKEMYIQLIEAAALKRSQKTLPAKPSSPATPLSEATAPSHDVGGLQKDIAPSREFQPQNCDEGRREDGTGSPVIHAPKDATEVPDGKALSLPDDQETEDEAARNISVCSNPRGSLGDTEVTQQDSVHQQQQHQDVGEPHKGDDADDSVLSEPSPLSAPSCLRTSTLSCSGAPHRQTEEGVPVADHVHETGDNGVDASEAESCSTSSADSSSLSGSSVCSEDMSWYDDDSDEAAAGILEDFTEGVDAWLDDVHGAGREAFFELFKRDATPQFCRPSLEVIGRNGIGSNFIDGEPNIKYLPQRPVELHEIVASPPSATPPTKVTPRRRPTRPAMGTGSLPQRPKSAAAATLDTERSTAADTTPDDKGQGPRPSANHVGRSTTKGTVDNRESLDQQARALPATRPAPGDPRRPHSSPSARGVPSRRSEEGRKTSPASAHSFTASPTRNQRTTATPLRGNSARVEFGKPEKPRPRRPQTADGRDIEATRHHVPFLDDPADPVMIAHRRMKRPQSPRRDYLIRCAEKQLLPVPVINRALRLDQSTNRRREPSRTYDISHGHEAGQEDTTAGKQSGAQGKSVVIRGGHGLGKGEAVQESQRHGCIMLRHYYLGAARAKCLENTIASVPVVLREVELVDSGLDDVASEALLGVLLGKIGTISKLNLARNRVGVKGATALARFIAHKDCALRTLNLDGNKAGDQPITVVLKALARHEPPVSHLGLADNRLTLKTMQGCAGPLLIGGLPLVSLDLGWNHLNQQAVEELADALAWNRTATEVNLEFNSSGDGVHALAEALQNNKTLTRLDLTANQVRWGGAVALSEVVATSAGLRNLVLRRNNIGTAAGLQMGIALARKSDATCLVDIQGCTCFSDKTDVWSGMNARIRAARAARIAAVRKRQQAVRARKKLKASVKNEKTTTTVTDEKARNRKKAPAAAQRTPPPLPPTTRPDEQLYWLDLTVDRKWDLRLHKPFDRAVGGEVLRVFNFSSGGSLVGTLRAPGTPPRRLVFLRREGLLLEEEKARTGVVPGSLEGYKAPAGQVKTPMAGGRANARGTMAGNKKAGKRVACQREAHHPLARWLNEWKECKERGWEGDVPPVGGLSSREEASRLLAQLPTEGTLQLSYTAGNLLCPKQSLLHDTHDEASDIPQLSASATVTLEQQPVPNRAAMKPGNAVETSRIAGAEEGRRVGSGSGEYGRSITAAGHAVGSGGGSEGGFGGLIFMLRSLESTMQMCEMVECLSRRTWLTDQQLCALSDAFSDEPRMSEPRCRVFLALLPNIRHNCLKALGAHLSQRVKRLQGIPPPDFSPLPRKKGAAADRARHWTRGASAVKTEEERKAEEDEEATRRARVLDDGWKGGPFFQGLNHDFVGVVAGCSASTFRRLGLVDRLTTLEAARLGSVVERTAYFNPFAPQGHYNLDLAMPTDRQVFRALQSLDKVNRAHVGIRGLLDPSQHGNGHHLRNFRLGGGRPVKFGLLSRRARSKLVKTVKKGKGAKKAPKKSAAKTQKKTPTAKTAGKAKPKPQPRRQGDMGPKKVTSSTKKKDKQPQSNAKPSGNPAFVKRYPTMPTVSRISFDFLHYIRPPAQATPAPQESFEHLMDFLTSWNHRRTVNGRVDDGGLNDGDRVATNGGGGKEQLRRTASDKLTVNLLRNLCHVFYFNCQQVVELLRIFPGEDDERERGPAGEPGQPPPSSKETDAKVEEEKGSSCREEAFIAVLCRIVDESNLDLCLGMLTNREVSRCEARLGPVALFMPTKPEGEYKLDLRAFADRQIVTLLLELERKDPTLQLLGIRHDGKYLEEGSASWSTGVPKRGRFRTRAVTRRAFKTAEQLAASEVARWETARSKLGWHERMPKANSSKLCTKPFPGAANSIEARTTAATAVDVKAGVGNKVQDDGRPRKRAVVRIPRKQKGPTGEKQSVIGMATAARRRIQSFSHLPRPHLSREEFIRYLGDTVTAEHAGDSGPTDVGVVSTILDKEVDGVKKKYIIGKDSDPHVPSASVIESGEVVLEGVRSERPHVSSLGSNATSGEVMSRKRLIRRWPSSADIGMVTNGR